jgi:hypothetical protein
MGYIHQFIALFMWKVMVLDTQLSQSKQLVAGPRSFIPNSFCWETRTIVAFHSRASSGKRCPDVLLTSGDWAEEIQKLVA